MADLPDPGSLPGQKLRAWGSKLVAFIKADRAVPGIGLTESNLGGQRAFNAKTSAAQGASSGGEGINLPSYPGVDGTYVLGVVITGSGTVATLQWIGTDTCA